MGTGNPLFYGQSSPKEVTMTAEEMEECFWALAGEWQMLPEVHEDEDHILVLREKISREMDSLVEALGYNPFYE